MVPLVRPARAKNHACTLTDSLRSVLGWGPGIVTMLLAGILFWITSMTMWKFIMKHPQIRDICDFAFYACGRSNAAYAFTGFMLLANNIMLVGYVLDCSMHDDDAAAAATAERR